MKTLKLIIALLIVTACKKVIPNENILEGKKWIVESVSPSNNQIQTYDTLTFSSYKSICCINSKNKLNYLSNNELLYIEFPAQKQVFEINKSGTKIHLKELYCNKPIALTIKPIEKNNSKIINQ